jgi:transcriptional regulator with XRE-family HTH domain
VKGALPVEEISNSLWRMPQTHGRPGRPPKTKSVLSVLLQAGHTIKEIAECSGVSHQTLRDVSCGKRKMSHANAEKITLVFPTVSIDFLLGMSDSSDPKPRNEYEDQRTTIQKLLPSTPADFDNAALRAVEDAAKLSGYDLPSDVMKRHHIAQQSVWGHYPTYTSEALAQLSPDQRNAARALGELAKKWKTIPDAKAPKHSSETTPKKEEIGNRMNLHQYLSYARSILLPQVERVARPDLMMAFEGLLLNAGTHNRSYIIAKEVLAMIQDVRKKYKIFPDFAFMRERMAKLNP